MQPDGLGIIPPGISLDEDIEGSPLLDDRRQGRLGADTAKDQQRISPRDSCLKALLGASLVNDCQLIRWPYQEISVNTRLAPIHEHRFDDVLKKSRELRWLQVACFDRRSNRGWDETRRESLRIGHGGVADLLFTAVLRRGWECFPNAQSATRLSLGEGCFPYVAIMVSIASSLLSTSSNADCPLRRCRRILFLPPYLGPMQLVRRLLMPHPEQSSYCDSSTALEPNVWPLREESLELRSKGAGCKVSTVMFLSILIAVVGAAIVPLWVRAIMNI